MGCASVATTAGIRGARSMTAKRLSDSHLHAFERRGICAETSEKCGPSTSAEILALVRERLRYEPKDGQFYFLPIKEATWRQRNWNYRFAGKIAGALNRKGYRDIHLAGRRFSAHRLVWLLETGALPTEIDHKNGLRCDNRFSNLREVTRRENCQNRKVMADNKSGLKGVWSHEGRWQAAICVDGKRIHLGSYDDAESAHRAYTAAASRHFGAFARVS